MASNTVQISVARLREGDFLEFKNSAEDQTYRIDVVASPTPLILEVQDTSDVIPVSEEWKVAVERLTEALQKVPIIESVSNEIRDNSTVITIIGDVDNNGYTFEDGDGSRWLFCKSITETGDVTVGSDALVPSIRIDEITHEIVGPFNYPAKSFPHGNALTRVKTTIDFTYLNSFASLGYQFGFVANSTNLFPNATNGNYRIDPTYFTDVIT